MAQVEAAIRESFRAEAEGRLGDALAFVARAGHPILQYREGKVLMRLERWGEAVETLLRSCSRDPEQAGLLSHTAFALRKTGRVAEARRALAAAARLDPHDIWVPAQRRALAGRPAPAPAPAPVPAARADGLALVTASNSLYFGCAANLVGSAQAHAPGAPVLLFDLGLSAMEREAAAAWRDVQARHPSPFSQPESFSTSSFITTERQSFGAPARAAVTRRACSRHLYKRSSIDFEKF